MQNPILIIHLCSDLFLTIYHNPALKKWGVYWFTSVRHSVLSSSCPSVTVFVSPAKQKRDICIAFLAAALSSSASLAA